MPEFLRKAACRGRQPMQHVSRRRISRPDLIARLLRERHVARFVVAPDGFGKTGLALEYADTVFSFEHVFWIDGKSPCFLRDLDRDVIASTLLGSDPQPFLAVFEDVPALDPVRVELLSNALDRLLDRSCEVLVTCAPSRDAFARHRDRVKLSSADLLLSDDEVDMLRTPAERAAEPAAGIARARRVVGLAWADGEERSAFLSRALDEELPSDLLLPMLVMATLSKGALEDVSAFGPFGDDQEALLADEYPYFGIDRQTGRFEAAPFAVRDIAEAFGRKLHSIAERSLFADAGALVSRLGDALVVSGAFERACDVVRMLAARPVRAVWLASHGQELFDAGCLVEASWMYRSLGTETAGRSSALSADEAERRALLGDLGGACVVGRKAARDAEASLAERVSGAIVLSRCAKTEQRRRADKLVGALLEASMGKGGALRGGEWAIAAKVHDRLATASCADAARVWLDGYAGGARDRFVKLAAVEIMASAAEKPLDAENATGYAGAADLHRFGAAVREWVSSRAHAGSLGLRDALVGMAYERACERGVLASPALDAKASLDVRRVEMDLIAQRKENERRVRNEAERERAFAATHPNAFRDSRRPKASPALSPSTPTLTVNLFGGLDVLMGDKRLDPTFFRRQKVKTLLALLVLHGGREFSRDKLVSLLWPESELEAARKNFYGIWSMLRRALSTAPGTCPYLIRQQQAVRLDPSLFVSDVAQLEDICRTLLFERPGYGGWAQVFSQINDKFSDDLLPSESDNDAIAALRADYRDKLVDASWRRHRGWWRQGRCRKGSGSPAPHCSATARARTPTPRSCRPRSRQASARRPLRPTSPAAAF